MANEVKCIKRFYYTSNVRNINEYELTTPVVETSIEVMPHSELPFFRSKLLRSNYQEIRPRDFSPGQRCEVKCQRTGVVVTLDVCITYERYECYWHNGDITEYILVV